MQVVEICAGAGGQALGLEAAGFEHALAVELDRHACETLRVNRPEWKVAEGDVADAEVWDPGDYEGVDLLAGGVPCPPFSVAGRQLGAQDERDLFAWAVETAGIVKPRALMLENVRGLSEPRFGAYRQHVLERLVSFGYQAEWRLLNACDFGVAQLRPRFVLVAMKEEDFTHFHWPEPSVPLVTVGESIYDLMGVRGWEHLNAWKSIANGIGPTIVGGSKKHGGADLGPTRAKQAWRKLGVDGMGVANDAPEPKAPHPLDVPPKLTVSMVARIQGWHPDWKWEFQGGKTAQYRQVGNAFPPPVAQAVGQSIATAFARQKPARELDLRVHDELYLALRNAARPMTLGELRLLLTQVLDDQALQRRIGDLQRDFEITVTPGPDGPVYSMGRFRAFVGQWDHLRHEYLAKYRNKVS